MTALDRNHRIVRARELAYAAGIPLRDRWGYAASDEDVLTTVRLVQDHSDDAEAANAIGIANALGDIQLCDGRDTPLEEEQELRLVQALRAL